MSIARSKLILNCGRIYMLCPVGTASRAVSLGGHETRYQPAHHVGVGEMGTPLFPSLGSLGLLSNKPVGVSSFLNLPALFFWHYVNISCY